MSVMCPDCGAPMELRRSRYGPFYGCSQFPACRGSHGAHPDGKPLGIPANQETKNARIKAHAAFDRLWKGGRMSKSKAYAWLSETLMVERDKAHIAMLDKSQCELVVRAAENEFKIAGRIGLPVDGYPSSDIDNGCFYSPDDPDGDGGDDVFQ